MKRYEITVLRRGRGSDQTYRQTFEYIASSDADTVASALREINSGKDIRDIEGEQARPVEWECSCLQKKCGACAMVIDGRPSLACDRRLADCASDKVTIEPLRKFPVIADLMVDRSILYENLKILRLWLRKDSDLPDKYRDLAYEASECIQCGCCLEICPNFYVGGKFFGMSGVPITTRLLSEMDKGTRKEIAKSYSKHVFGGCGKSLACKDVCPRHIDTEKLLVNSNAMAVWKRR